MTDRTFFPAPTPQTLSALAETAGAELVRGDGAQTVDGIGPVEACESGALTFVTGGRYLAALADTKAAAVVVGAKHLDRVPDRLATIVARDPYRAFAKMATSLFPSSTRPLRVTGEDGVSPRAFVDPSAQLAPDVVVEAGAVVGADARVADGVVILANAVIGAGVSIGAGSTVAASASVIHASIGERSIVHPGVRIGQDGFGYAMGAEGHFKVPQVGGVVIGDDVEIGAGTTIDRGANRDTIIGSGTKIDNLVQVGHNVVMGRHCVIVAGVMIAGSCELGDFVVLGGGTCLTGHCTIGSGAQVSGMSGVSEDVAPGQQVGGIPARPIRHWIREVAAIRRDGRKDAK